MPGLCDFLRLVQAAAFGSSGALSVSSRQGSARGPRLSFGLPGLVLLAWLQISDNVVILFRAGSRGL